MAQPMTDDKISRMTIITSPCNTETENSWYERNERGGKRSFHFHLRVHHKSYVVSFEKNPSWERKKKENI